MTQFNSYFNQICNLCIWLNINTRVVANVIYDGEDNSLNVDLIENHEKLYTHYIDGLGVKTDAIINLEMNRLVNYLLNLKQEYENKIV